MIQVVEGVPVRVILEYADSKILSQQIAPDLQAIMVETMRTDDVVADDDHTPVQEIEGVLLYFPGVTAKQLRKGF